LPPPPQKPPQSSPDTLAAGVVALVAAALVLPTLTAPLLVDERVMAFEAIKWLGLDPLAPWSLPLGGSGTWRPLLPYLFRLDADAPAWVRHLGSGTGYVVLCVGVFAWLRQRFALPAATLGAAWFAAHGAHVAVAGWVGGRADLAMGIAAVIALIAWDRERVGIAAAAVAVAVLCKETAIVLPAVLWWMRRDPRAWIPAIAAAAPFAVGLAIQEVDAAYLPGPGAWASALPIWPLYAVEAFVPTFRPLAVPRGPDLLGLVVAVAATLACLRGAAPKARLALGAAAVAAVPVLHVLPNDGGDWYLLLPTIPLAAAWASIAERRPRAAASVVVAVLAVGIARGWTWHVASTEVARTIDAGDARSEPPPRQDPRDWPHVGPSFCCGFPYQLFADPRAEIRPPSPPEASPADSR